VEAVDRYTDVGADHAIVVIGPTFDPGPPAGLMARDDTAGSNPPYMRPL
jgi:hypothetical protein